MKLLLDRNISYRLVRKIETQFPGRSNSVKLDSITSRTRRSGTLQGKRDLSFVTFDSDFYDLSLTYGHPPKLIWLKTGNMTTRNLEKLFADKAAQIEDFAVDPELSCLEIID